MALKNVAIALCAAISHAVGRSTNVRDAATALGDEMLCGQFANPEIVYAYKVRIETAKPSVYRTRGTPASPILRSDSPLSWHEASTKQSRRRASMCSISFCSSLGWLSDDATVK